MTTVSFSLYVAPSGEVYESTGREGKIAGRLVEAIYEEEFEEIDLDPGGMVVMSTDVNATAGKRFLGWAKAFTRKWFQRAMKSQMVDREMMKLLNRRGVDTGWSVGNLFRGRYYDPKDGEAFNEKSFSVDMRGVPMDFVYDAGRILAKKFKQQSTIPRAARSF